MPVPSPVVFPLALHTLERIAHPPPVRMPSPLQATAAQCSRMQSAPILNPMPVVEVSEPAVELVLLTEHCEMWHRLRVVIPAEEASPLVLARAEQPIRTHPEVTEMPAEPPFD